MVGKLRSGSMPAAGCAVVLLSLLLLGGLAADSAGAAGLTAVPVPGSTAMFGVSCPTQSVCWAVGESGSAGVVAEILNGVAQAATAVSGTGPLAGIACWDAADCVAVGDGPAGGLTPGGVVVAITGGVPQTTQEVSAVGAGLEGVSCETSSTCIAVGRSTYPGGVGDVVPILSGTVQGVQQVANTSWLSQIDCYDSSDCTATGILLSAPPPAVASEAGEVVPISGTSPGAANQIDNSDGVDAIACPPSSSACIGGMGVYVQSPEVISVDASVPGVGTPDSDFSQFKGAACQTASTCYLVGFGSSSGGEVTTVTNGAPGAGQSVSGSYELVGASCSPGGTCWAVGWGANEQPPGTAVQLSTGNLVSGTVTDTKDKSVAGATITLKGTTSQGASVNQTALTAADGSYSFSVQPGNYSVDARSAAPTSQSSGGTWKTLTCSGTSGSPGTCSVALAAGASSTADFAYLLPDLMAENLEITQGVQDVSWDSGGGALQIPGLGNEPGGAYTGVKLVRGVSTVVRVYASVYPDPNAQSVSNVPAVLHGYADNSGALTELPGSPISAPDRTLDVGPMEPMARVQPSGAYTFTLPSAWTAQRGLTLVAQVDPESGGQRPVAECANCGTDGDYALSGITLTQTAPITIEPFQIDYTFRLPDGAGTVREVGPNLSGLLQRAQDVLPLAPGDLKVAPFPVAVLDITAQIQKIVHFWRAHNGFVLRRPDLSTCVAVPNCRADIESFEYDAVNRLLALPHGHNLFRFGFEPISDGVTWTRLGTSIIGADNPPRPLTSATHELLHDLGFLHASPGCGGGANGQVNAPWPPDQLGYIQGIGLDRRPNSGGPGLYRIMAPGVGAPQWFDLMSYCTLGADARAWISTVNWNKFVNIDAVTSAPSADAGATATAAASAAAGSAPRMVVDAGVSPNGQVQMLGAGTSVQPPSASVASPYRLAVLGAHGQMLDDLGVAAQSLDDGPAKMLTAVVPAAGVRTLELISGHRVVARLTKPSPAPSVKVMTPRRATVHHGLTIRWRARGARGVQFTAAVQYLASTRRGWTTVAAGLLGDTWRLPAAAFRGTRSVRVRVIINDGFSDAAATSRAIRVRPS